MHHVYARYMYSSCRIFVLPGTQVPSSRVIILDDMIQISLSFQLKTTNKLKPCSLTVDMGMNDFN